MTKVTETNTQVLAGLPFLGGLPEGELLALNRRCHARHVPKGATIFEEGAAAVGLFLILEGRVKLVRTSEKGREHVLHAEGAGATLGEVPLFDGGGYLASAIAVEAVHLLFIPGDALFDLVRQRPDVALGIIRVLARKRSALPAPTFACRGRATTSPPCWGRCGS